LSTEEARRPAGLVLPASETPTGHDDTRVIHYAIPIFAALIVLAWVRTTIATASGQWGDHFEQFVWAHGLEWGYHKHPPLPTWLLAGTIATFGPSVFWPYALASLCVLGTALFTYAIARMLFGDATAALALLLIGLQHAFSARASLFNHNSVMLLTVSATAWCVLRALASKRNGLAWWICGGATAAMAVLSKYQAVVPLVGIVVGAALSGDLASRGARRGLLVAGGIATLLLAPHLAWMLDGNSSAIDYATQNGRKLSSAASLWNVAGFLAQQLRFMLASLLFFGIVTLLAGARGARVAGDLRRSRTWLLGLVGFPLCVTVLTGPLFGIELQNHWGYQALQFISLWLAWRLRPLAPVAGGGWLAAALMVHFAFLGIAATTADVSLGKKESRIDNLFPAQALADAVLWDWKNDTLCPLALIVGPTFEAGMISVYNGGTAKVLEDGNFSKSPWIKEEDLKRLGAVYVSTDPAELPREGVSVIDSLDVTSVSTVRKGRIYWAIVPPESCDSSREN
jgi:4-amino-4-deoxy-L-arabinose transferase-like glycosyltransferase